MRHAEAIAERASNLGGEPVAQPRSIRIGKTLMEIIEIDKSEEEVAITLYSQIIVRARGTGDTITEKLFRRILKDEEGHQRIFPDLVKEQIAEKL
jgi:bacterioferritin (cytochrome b1)